MKLKTNFVRAVVFAGAISSAGMVFAGSACDISQQMQQIQTAEKKRQTDGVNTRFNDIEHANDLQRACLENFPAYPTQLPSTAVLIAAFNKIKQSACKSISKNAAQIQNQVQNQVQKQVQKQVQNQLGQQNGINPAIMQQIQNQTQGGTVAPASTGIVDKAMDAMKRLFQ